MITYIYTIDPYNSIIIEDGEIFTIYNPVKFMESLGFGLVYLHKGEKKRRCARRKLNNIVAARNFHFWDKMVEERGLI